MYQNPAFPKIWKVPLFLVQLDIHIHLFREILVWFRSSAWQSENVYLEKALQLKLIGIVLCSKIQIITKFEDYFIIDFSRFSKAYLSETTDLISLSSFHSSIFCLWNKLRLKCCLRCFSNQNFDNLNAAKRVIFSDSSWDTNSFLLLNSQLQFLHQDLKTKTFKGRGTIVLKNIDFGPIVRILNIRKSQRTAILFDVPRYLELLISITAETGARILQRRTAGAVKNAYVWASTQKGGNKKQIIFLLSTLN